MCALLVGGLPVEGASRMTAARCRDCGSASWTEQGTCSECRAFPTLGWDVGALIEAKCAIPDGDLVGDPLVLTDDQWRTVLHHYRVDPQTGRFVYFRGTQLTRPQKWGKGPLSAAFVCAEAHPEGPVLFDGWDAGGQPVGRPWPTPHVQVTAVSEDQTENVYRCLLPMIRLGALGGDIPDTGLTRINLPTGGLIEPVTAAAVSRLGQRVTFVVQDQTESWLRANGGHKLADNQRRGLAGMKGRFLSTPNAWDPREDSVAQRTGESPAPGVYHDDVDPGAGSVRNKSERRRMLKRVYGDSAVKPRADAPWEPWIDLDRIDGEIVALLEHDPPQAERFFLNRKLAGEDAAIDHQRWAELATDYRPPPRSLICLGVDGARFSDALAVVATHVESGYQWPVFIAERPDHAGDSYEHDLVAADGAVTELFEEFDVWRAYVDDQYIEGLVDRWQGRWGDKRVVGWHTNRPRQMAWAVRAFTEAIGAGDVSHPGDAVVARHFRNARRMKLNVYDEHRRQMHSISKDRPDSPRKIDALAAAILSWEARGDAIAAGMLQGREPLIAVL